MLAEYFCSKADSLIRRKRSVGTVSYTHLVERLKELRLDVPQVTLLAYELQKSGLALPDGILTAEELKRELKKLRDGE